MIYFHRPSDTGMKNGSLSRRRKLKSPLMSLVGCARCCGLQWHAWMDTYSSPPGHLMGSLLTTLRRTWRETVGHQQHMCRGSLLTAMCVSAGALSTRLCADLPPSPQTEVSKMDVDTGWAKGANLQFFSHHSFCIAQVRWATSQTGTITSLVQECSFPRGQLIHPARLHHLRQYGVPREPLSSLLGERFLEPALFSALQNTRCVFYSLMKICAQGS